MAMFIRMRRWATRRKRGYDGPPLGEKERAERERIEAANDSLFPGYGQTGARVWQDRTDSEYDRPR